MKVGLTSGRYPSLCAFPRVASLSIRLHEGAKIVGTVQSDYGSHPVSRRAYHSERTQKESGTWQSRKQLDRIASTRRPLRSLSFKKVLYRHPLLEPIHGADHEFLLELLKKHPRKTEKIGVGVKHFTFEKAQGGTQCFSSLVSMGHGRTFRL